MTVHIALAEAADYLPQATALGVEIAKRLNTSVHGVSVMPDPATTLLMTGAGAGLYMSAGSTVIQSVEQAQGQTRQKLEADFRALCEKAGLPADRVAATHLVGLPEQEVARAAILSDALVFPHDCAKSGGSFGAAFEYTLMSRRQPVIIAGEQDAPTLSVVMIAWDGSPEAARAVRFNEPLIRAADRVVIAQNQDRIDPQDMKGPEDPAIVRDWLKARGVDAAMRSFAGDIADGLLKLAAEEKAGLLIAGAYGHSRVEEFIFGGVSRSLLRSEDGPALALAH